MARTRTLLQLRTEMRQLADIESATNRFPDSELTRLVNQGIAYVYDLLVSARARTYYRKHPAEVITTTADTVEYALPSDFYQMLGVRVDGGDWLEEYGSLDEAALDYEGTTSSNPLYYELMPGYIALRPRHDAGTTVLLDYVPTAAELVDDADTFDGINGWEDGVILWGAIRCAIKDEAFERAGHLRNVELPAFERRVKGLAGKRDRGRPERIQDARGIRALRGMRGGRFMV